MKKLVYIFLFFVISCVPEQQNSAGDLAGKTEFRHLSSDERSYIFNEIENGYLETTELNLQNIEKEFLGSESTRVDFVHRKGKLEKVCTLKAESVLKSLKISGVEKVFYKIEDKEVTETLQKILNINGKDALEAAIISQFTTIFENEISSRESLDELKATLNELKLKFDLLESLTGEDLERLRAKVQDLISQIDSGQDPSKSLLVELELELSALWRKLPDSNTEAKSDLRASTINVGKYAGGTDEVLKKLKATLADIEKEDINELKRVKFIKIRGSDSEVNLPLSIDGKVIPASDKIPSEMLELLESLSELCS